MRLMHNLIIIVVLAGTAMCAQHHDGSDPNMKVKGSGELPAGWQMRLDKASASSNDVKFLEEKNGYHVVSGPAAIYYKSADQATGRFQADVVFSQVKASRHPEAYGLFFGGENLQEKNQQYFYFLIRQDGKYLIKKRVGEGTSVVVDWTENKAVNKIDASGQAHNRLTVKITEGEAVFLVNGEQVHARPLTDRMKTDGQVGLRINHNLDVRFSGFVVKPLT